MTRLLAAFVGIAVVVVVARTAPGQSLDVGALPQGSPAHGITFALANVVGDNSRLSLRPMAFDRTSVALSNVDQGKLTMAVSSAISANFALHGTKVHKGQKLSNLRILARLLTYRAGFVVRRESDIRKISDFKGRRFPIRFTGQGVLETLARAAFATEGMNFKDVNGASVENFATSMGELVAGRIEGSFLAPGSRTVRQANASVKIRFLSINQSPRTTAVVRRIAPGAFFSVVKPRRRLSFIDKPTTLLGIDFLLMTSSGVRSSIAYEIVKTLYLGRKNLIAKHPLFRDFESKLMGKKGIGPAYHPGAIKFYSEAGIW